MLEDQGSATGLEVLGVELLEFCQLPEGVGRRVVGINVDGVVAIGQEINRVAGVDWIAVVAIVPGEFVDRVVAQVEDPDRLVLPSAVVTPLVLVALDHLVGELLAARRELAAPGPRHRHRLGESAVDRDRPELGIGHGRAGSTGGEDDRLAIVGPAPGGVGAGVPGQALRFATVDRYDVDVRVAIVLTREGHRAAVRRELGVALDALEAGQAPCVTALASDDPQVSAVGKDDVLGADVGVS